MSAGALQVFFEDEGLWRAEVLQDVGAATAQADGVYDPSQQPWDGIQLCDRYKACAPPPTTEFHVVLRTT